jgi:hypothetical protein
MSGHLLLGVFSEKDAALLGAAVAADIDARFLKADLSQGSRIPWGRISIDMQKLTGRNWTKTCVVHPRRRRECARAHARE